MDDCLFCKLASKKIETNIIYEDDNVVAFPDIASKAPTHILIVPKKHIKNLVGITTDEEGLLGHLLWVSSFLASEQGVDETGFRIVINNGPDSGQEVDHIHLHLLGGRRLSSMG